MKDYKEIIFKILSEESYDQNQEELIKSIKNNFQDIGKDLEKGNDTKLRKLLKTNTKSKPTSTTPARSDNKSGISKTGSTEKPVKPVPNIPKKDDKKDDKITKKGVLDKLSDKWNAGKELSSKIDSSLNSIATSLVGNYK